MKLSNLYFGIKYKSLVNNELKACNLFELPMVKKSVAYYVLMDETERKKHILDPAFFCFGDLQGRTEWEFEVDGKRTNVYEMYIEPNRDYLIGLVDSVSQFEAKKYLKEHKS